MAAITNFLSGMIPLPYTPEGEASFAAHQAGLKAYRAALRDGLPLSECFQRQDAAYDAAFLEAMKNAKHDRECESAARAALRERRRHTHLKINNSTEESV